MLGVGYRQPYTWASIRHGREASLWPFVYSVHSTSYRPLHVPSITSTLGAIRFPCLVLFHQSFMSSGPTNRRGYCKKRWVSPKNELAKNVFMWRVISLRNSLLPSTSKAQSGERSKLHLERPSHFSHLKTPLQFSLKCAKGKTVEWN